MINVSLFCVDKRILLSFKNLSNINLVWLSWEPEPPMELHLLPVYPSNKLWSVLYLIEPWTADDNLEAELPEGIVKCPVPLAFRLP